VLALLAGAIVYSQTPQALTDMEKLRIENLNLKQSLASTLKAQAETAAQLGACQAQVNASVVRSDAAALKLDLEGGRPGYVFNFEKNVFEKKPEGKPDPPKK
jgi:hypothetical protein